MKKVILILGLILLIALLNGCTEKFDKCDLNKDGKVSALEKQKCEQPDNGGAGGKGKCGDGICGPVERQKGTCPEDCTQSTQQPEGKIGFIGCSLTLGALDGYSTLGGARFWPYEEADTYPGGSVFAWYNGVNSASDKRWQTFLSLMEKYPETKIIWWELCTGTESNTYTQLTSILNKIKTSATDAEIYVSAIPERKGYTCSLENNQYTTKLKEYAEQLVQEGKAKEGPVMTPLTISQVGTDKCHPNPEGQEVWGQNLIDFFGKGSVNINSNNSITLGTPLNFATYVHIEGQLKIDDEGAYEQITKQLKEIVDLFSKYDAKVTLESEMPYAEAVIKYGKNDDALHYALEKGQGTGTHCDVTFDGRAAVQSETELAEEYKSRKDVVDSIVGKDNNRGCSGGWAPYDWAKAAKEAGFSYLDAPVMLAYLAVPMGNRPINPETNKPFTDEEIKKVYYHDPVPAELEKRIYPMFLKDTNDLEDDGEGILLITGSLGEISSLYEDRKNCFPNCVLTADDADYIIDKIDYVNSIKDDSKIAMLEIHFPASTLKQSNGKQIVEAWLKKMQQYQNEGKIKWRTMGEMYDIKKNS